MVKTDFALCEFLADVFIVLMSIHQARANDDKQLLWCILLIGITPLIPFPDRHKKKYYPELSEKNKVE